MRVSLFFILSLFFLNADAQQINSIEKNSYIRNIKAFNVSYPTENLFLLEEITKTKKLQRLEKLSADSFVKSDKFKQLYLLLNNDKINTGFIIEKRTKEFFINREDSAERLQVIFKNKNYYWIPVEIKLKKNKKLESILSIDHPLFNILLKSTADSYHFQDFAEHWNQYPKKKFTIISTVLQQAVIEHVIFFKQINDSTKVIENIFSIHYQYFHPGKSPKNGWLITDIIEERNNINYDLTKARNYIPPIYVIDRPKRNGSINLNPSSISTSFANLNINNNHNLKSNKSFQDIKNICTYQDKNNKIKILFFMKNNIPVVTLHLAISHNKFALSLHPAKKVSDFLCSFIN